MNYNVLLEIFLISIFPYQKGKKQLKLSKKLLNVALKIELLIIEWPKEQKNEKNKEFITNWDTLKRK